MKIAVAIKQVPLRDSPLRINAAGTWSLLHPNKKLDPALNAMTDAVTHPTQPYVEMSFGMGKDGFPAISMTQHAANKYCEWLSAKTGHFYRLPTEAGWEYAARAGTTTAYFWGDDPKQIGDYCWWGKNSDFKYQKVGKKKPNPWGLYDTHGNVLEWCLDVRVDKLPGGSDPLVATEGTHQVCRGGSWDLSSDLCRSAYRGWYDRSFRDYSVGFRVAFCPLRDK